MCGIILKGFSPLTWMKFDSVPVNVVTVSQQQVNERPRRFRQ